MEEDFFAISVAAERAGMHAQTLRTYDRLGLVRPERTSGGGRRYSQKDIDRLLYIQRMSQEEGINLAGIKQIIALQDKIEHLQNQLIYLTNNQVSENNRGELVHVPRSTEVVLWSFKREKHSS